MSSLGKTARRLLATARGTAPPGAVCMSAQEFMPTLTTKALVSLVQSAPQGSVFLTNHLSCTIARKRNALVTAFLEHKPQLEWLLFVDSDMMPLRDSIARLLAWNVDVVGALYFGKGWPFPAEAWCDAKRMKVQTDLSVDGKDALKQVDAIGAGCLLVRRHVFTDLIPFPWFESEDKEGYSEDIAFCKKLSRAGVTIYCDTGLVAGHLTTISVDLEHVMEQAYLYCLRSESQRRA